MNKKCHKINSLFHILLHITSSSCLFSPHCPPSPHIILATPCLRGLALSHTSLLGLQVDMFRENRVGLVVTGLGEKKGLAGKLKFLFSWNEKFSEILCWCWTVSRCDP
jgi:hypothetical protein